MIFCGTPSSKTWKSSAVSPLTGLPFLSRTTTSTSTAAVDVPNLGRCDGAWRDNAGRSATSAMSATTTKVMTGRFNMLPNLMVPWFRVPGFIRPL